MLGCPMHYRAKGSGPDSKAILIGSKAGRCDSQGALQLPLALPLA